MKLKKHIDFILMSLLENNDIKPDENGNIYYGVHEVVLTRDSNTIKVEAKFDTGAKSSSIDFGVAEKLGLSKELIDKCKKLDHIDVPKSITEEEQTKLEEKYTNDLKSEFPEITKVKISKSSSGFSARGYIEVNINYLDKNILTEVNLRDRSGLSCEMIIGLKDIL